MNFTILNGACRGRDRAGCYDLPAWWREQHPFWGAETASETAETIKGRFDRIAALMVENGKFDGIKPHFDATTGRNLPQQVAASRTHYPK